MYRTLRSYFIYAKEKETMETFFYKTSLGTAKCAVDLGDGSERGEYVCQDYILTRLYRPHRAISLMYCYYPHDKGWPERASIAHAHDANFAWDYPYDDYFPYEAGIGTDGDLESKEPFRSMRDIRRHGQEVSLTLTIDPFLEDEYIKRLAEELSSFGRMFLRINHEATGNWFSFNKRADYQQVADFYVRAARIFKETAPHISLVLCAGSFDEHTGRIEKEDEFLEAHRVCDIWSIDKYPALHWQWPYSIAERGGSGHNRIKISDVFKLAKKTKEHLKAINGGIVKPMSLAELNADGDVTGPYDQVSMMREMYSLIECDNGNCLNSVSMYQFRDRGRLGLETENPNNPQVGIEQPLLAAYREIILRDFFQPSLTRGDKCTLPIRLRWGCSEDAEGIEIPIIFEKNPIYCEAFFNDENNYMIEFNGMWFYKAPTTKFVDFMPALFNKDIAVGTELSLRIFAPPASGENDLSIPDGTINCYTTVTNLPKLRIRYEPVEL